MNTFLLVSWLITAVAGGLGIWWYRRRALVEIADAKIARNNFKVERALRRKAQGDAKVTAQALAKSEATANAMYERLREEDKKVVDEIARTGNADAAAAFLREAWNRGSGSRGPEDRGVRRPEAAHDSAAGIIEDL